MKKSEVEEASELIRNVSSGLVLFGLTIDPNLDLPHSVYAPKRIQSLNDFSSMPGICDIEHSVITNYDKIATPLISGHLSNEIRDYLAYEKAKSFCSFWPSIQFDALRKFGFNVFGNLTSLHDLLNSKFDQLELISMNGSDWLKSKIKEKSQRLKTQFVVPRENDYIQYNDLYGSFVITAPNSVAGSGVFLVQSQNDYWSALRLTHSPVVKLEKFVKSISLTQHGVVFPDETLSYPTYIQFILDDHCRLRFSGGSSNTINIPEHILLLTSRYTSEVGSSMAKLGYRGSFGCDFIYDIENDTCHISEVNPRFVGEFHFTASLVAASRDKIPNIVARSLLDPIILHLISFKLRRAPTSISRYIGKNGVINIGKIDDLGFDMFIPVVSGSGFPALPKIVSNSSSIGITCSSSEIEKGYCPAIFSPNIKLFLDICFSQRTIPGN